MRGVGGPPELFCTQAIWDHETGVALDFEVTSDKRQAKVSDLGSRNLGSRATSDERRTTSATSKICPSTRARGAQKSCKSTALAELHKRQLNDHFWKDAACAIAGLATALPAELPPLPISCRLGRWRRAIRTSPLAFAAGPAVFRALAPVFRGRVNIV